MLSKIAYHSQMAIKKSLRPSMIRPVARAFAADTTELVKPNREAEL